MWPFKKTRERKFEQNNGERMQQATNLRLSQNDRIRNLIRHEMFRAQINNESETFEDADDFELPDNEEWVSPYEETFDPDFDAAPPQNPPSPEPPNPAPASPEPQKIE